MRKWLFLLLIPMYMFTKGSACPGECSLQGPYLKGGTRSYGLVASDLREGSTSVNTYIHGGQWSKEKEHHLTSCADKVYDKQLSPYPSFHYPFSGIKKIRLKEQNRETLTLFSYGSLINLKSACKVLSPASLETRLPAIAFGVIRLFNYDPKKTSLGPPKDPNYRAMLNMEKTNRAEDLVNGVVIEIPKESLTELCEREVGYDLVPILYTLWKEGLEVEAPACPTFKVAYAFIAPDQVAGGESRINRTIKPRPDYFKLVKEGAAEYGPDYLQLFLETTYTADKKPI